MNFITSCCGRPIEDCPGCPGPMILRPSKKMKKISPLAEYFIGHCHKYVLLESSNINDALNKYYKDLEFEPKALLPFIKRAHTDMKLPANLPFVELQPSQDIIDILDQPAVQEGTPAYTIYMLMVGEKGLALAVAGRVREDELRARGQYADRLAYTSQQKLAVIRTSKLNDDISDILHQDSSQLHSKGPKQDWSEPWSRIFTFNFEELVFSSQSLRFFYSLLDSGIGALKHTFLAAVHNTDTKYDKPKEAVETKSAGQQFIQKITPILHKIVSNTTAEIHGRIKQYLDAGAYQRIEPLVKRGRALSILNKALKTSQDFPAQDVDSMPEGPRKKAAEARDIYLDEIINIAFNSAILYIEQSPKDIPWISLNDRKYGYTALMDNLKNKNPAAISMVLYFFKQALVTGDWYA